jgi:hypothetical protein
LLVHTRRTRGARPAVGAREPPVAAARGRERLGRQRVPGVRRTGCARRGAVVFLVRTRRTRGARPAVGPRVARVARAGGLETTGARRLRVRGARRAVGGTRAVLVLARLARVALRGSAPAD